MCMSENLINCDLNEKNIFTKDISSCVKIFALVLMFFHHFFNPDCIVDNRNFGLFAVYSG